MNPPRIALCAGEASGDLLGADLVRALRERFPDAQFAGITGPKMRAAGVETWWDASQLSVMGLVEVLRHLPRLLRLRRDFRRRVLDWKPDVFIGIDAPDFNLGVEKWLKARGIRTVHDVSPSVWAWREERAEKIGESADRVLCLFPMEPPIYAKHGVDARFIGHPLADSMPLQPDHSAARRELGIADDAPVLAVLPGSRMGEIERMLPIFLAAAEHVAKDIPNLQIVVPAADEQCKSAIEHQLTSSRFAASNVRILDGHAQQAMIASDAVLLASGTAALEAMLAKRPMVIGHRISPTTYRIIRAFGLLKSRFVSLPNILAGRALVPECLQDECTPQRLATELLRWLRDPAAFAAIEPEFLRLHEELRRDASRQAASAIAELLDHE
ncbi:lipid-A-disaccharide synthase [Solilutibacter silvestris]|uniref:Lipid-A-disaccharide synthase n=1 Tax=Solilutibacter silvestris TaxID=1645665 RepID=A0A2K1Q3B2_9GAMM|nr:lipid-A-disaccharide synthase [Lysobacter silvestris]PNS09542.1 lpxB: lipid-A-disaccharide synthase [Lysobacter silvestris]